MLNGKLHQGGRVASDITVVDTEALDPFSILGV